MDLQWWGERTRGPVWYWSWANRRDGTEVLQLGRLVIVSPLLAQSQLCLGDVELSRWGWIER